MHRILHLLKTSLAAQLYGLVACLTLVAWATFYWGHLHSEASGLEQVRLRASTLALACSEHLAHRLEHSSDAPVPRDALEALLAQFAQQLAPDSGALVAVMRRDGQVLAASADPQDYLPPQLLARAARQLSEQAHSNAPAYAPLSDDSAQRMLGLHPVAGHALVALVSIDTARQMAPDRKRKHIVLIFAVLFPLVLLGATRMILLGLARRAAAEKSLRDSERLAASVFTHASEAIVITDISGRILDVNSTFSRITGYSREEVLGHTPDMLWSEQQSPEFYAALRRDLALTGQWSGELLGRRSDADLFAAQLTISTVRDAQEVPLHYVALFTDTTQARDQERQLAQLVHYDALSSLPNRVLLADRLGQAMLQCQRRGKWLAVAFLDLDSFREVNDRHGHDVGDALLIAVAHNMKAALRDGDTLARMGGDEFVVVLADLDHKQECYPVLDRLLAAAHKPNLLRQPQVDGSRAVPDLSLQVSTSIGFTFYPQDQVDADQLLRQADQAMYQAKQGGKNRYHQFDVAVDAERKTQSESLERIRQALANEEFVLYYQPKVNMRTGQVIGAEALIRWQHPQRGLLAPLHFLPVVENHPLSIALGEWVVSTALRQMVQWQAQQLHLRVSVNISARHLQQENFSVRLADLLARFPDMAPDALELEVLETSAMEDMAQVTENIHRCHALGVHFALDDFGTGYSSLTYLKRLPAEVLKIDQSFVRDMLQDADDRAIVQSIIGLAESFNRTVIAEGVETPAHGDLLLQMGCELAQGYGIARPMPSAALLAWVVQWSADFLLEA